MANVDYDNGFVVGYAVGGSQTISSGGGGIAKPVGLKLVTINTLELSCFEATTKFVVKPTSFVP